MTRTGGGPGNQYGVSAHDMTYGATPIEPDHNQFLLPVHQNLRTLAELAEVEAENIIDATLWLEDQDFPVEQLLKQQFLRELHQWERPTRSARVKQACGARRARHQSVHVGAANGWIRRRGSHRVHRCSRPRGQDGRLRSARCSCDILTCVYQGAMGCLRRVAFCFWPDARSSEACCTA